MPIDFLTTRANEGYSGQTDGRPFSFKMEDTGKKYHIKFLNSAAMEVRIHYQANSAPVFCNLQYFAKDDPEASCVECDKPNLKYPGRPNKPQLVKLAMGYCLEFVGAKVPGKEFEENPIKVIGVPAGKGKCNFKFLDEGIADGDFTEKFWRFEKTADAYVPPTAVDDKKLPKYDKDLLAAALAEWGSKSDEEIASIVIGGYANIKWEHPSFKSNGLKDPFPQGVPAELPKGSSEPIQAGGLD